MKKNLFKTFGLATLFIAAAFNAQAGIKKTLSPTVDKLQELAKSTIVIQTVTASNKEYQKFNRKQKRSMSMAYRKELSSKNHPLIDHLTQNDGAQALKKFLDTNTNVKGLILLNASAYAAAQTYNPKGLRQYFAQKQMQAKHPKTKISSRAKSPFKNVKTARVLIPIIKNKHTLGALLAYTLI